MEFTAIGIDIAKNVFQLHGMRPDGSQVRKRLSRVQVLPYMANVSCGRVGIEACGGSNYWARELIKLGHDVRVIPTQYVKPFVRTNKNDSNDAEAICEAVQRPNMRFVPVRTLEQQRLSQQLNRRNRWVKNRTELVNQIRAELLEVGIVFGRNIDKLRKGLVEFIADQDSRILDRQYLQDALAELSLLDERIKAADRQICLFSRTDETCRRLQGVPGVGPITAMALRAWISPAHYKNGRHLSASLGLVPRQHSSGETQRLGSISKRGNGYLRQLLIHGARAALRVAHRHPNDRRLSWAIALKKRKGTNRAAVALANQNARTLLALLRGKSEYQAAM